MMVLILITLLSFPLVAREPLAQRIAHTDPSKYRQAPRVHGGAGELHFTGLFDAYAFNTNLIFLHRGVIPPKGGIGHHYHNQMEEMFVIFDNRAQFTVDGRTAELLPVNGFLSGVSLPLGAQQVLLRVRRWPLYLGFGIAAIGVLLALLTVRSVPARREQTQRVSHGA